MEYCIIHDKAHTVEVPLSLRTIGVENDKNTNRIYFKSPRYVNGTKIDLRDRIIKINYMNAKGEKGIYEVDDLEVTDSEATFSWLLDSEVTLYKGIVRFVICVAYTNVDGEVINEWNTALNEQCTVKEGLECPEVTQEDIDSFVTGAKLNDVENREYCVIHDETHSVEVPISLRTIGVEHDDRTNRIYFKSPRYVSGEKIDLRDRAIQINYMNAKGEKDAYIIDDLEVSEDGEEVTFSWLLSRRATKYKGVIRFVVCVTYADEDGKIIDEWNTALNQQFQVKEGLECIVEIPEEEEDVIASLLTAMRESANKASENAELAEEYAKQAEEWAQKNHSAEDIAFDNEGTDIEADNVQDAIVELTKGKGTADYNKLINKPTLNGEEFVGDMVESDPTVPDWAKTPEKPTYEASEVNAVDVDNHIPYEDIDNILKTIWG